MASIVISLTTPGAANGAAITGYTLYRGTTPGGQSATPIAENVTLPFTDTGLTGGNTYYYKAAGVNSAGTGAKSAEVSAVAAASPTVTISGAISKAEGNSGANLYTYTVTRSSTTGATSVPWSFTAGSTAAGDFTGGTYPTGGSVVLADGVASGTFTVSVNGDTVVEPDETFTVLISTPSGYVAGAATSATGTILNDDGGGSPSTIGGTVVGSQGAAGTIYANKILVDGDDFDTVSAADFLTPTNNGGTYMTTRHYGVQSSAPRYLRGAASLGGYEADPWHSGFKNAGRGTVPTSFADTIVFGGGAVKIKSRRATTGEQALMGPLSAKANLSSMVHMARRNMMRAPMLMEMSLRYPSALATWDQWHPTFWVIQSQPGNGFDGLELDCEGFSANLQFNRNTWNNGVGSYGTTLGTTSPVSKTTYVKYGFEIVQESGVWVVKLYENEALVASGSPDLGGNTFDPTRPFHLMLTNHILQAGLTQSVFDVAGDTGAVMDCDYWRVFMPTTGQYRTPTIGAAQYLADFGTAFSFTLPSPATVWGAGASGDVIEMIPNEDNSPAQPWVRGLLPSSVTRTGDTLAGTISDQPGRLVLARSYTPVAGDGCKPQPITICIGPRLLASAVNFTPNVAFSYDLFAQADFGDLHSGATIAVTGLPSGLSYSSSTGLITGTTASTSNASVTVTLTNAVGQNNVVSNRGFGMTALAPNVTMSAALSQNEGNSGATLFTYTVTRSSTTGATSVPWSFTAGTTSADDFTGGVYPAGGNVALADGVASGTITISVAGDVSVESNETFTVSITAPSGYTAGASMSATGTILNDDSGGTAPAFESWSNLVANFDASDATKFPNSTGAVATWANKATSGGNLATATQTTQTTDRVLAQQNGLAIARFTRGASQTTVSIMEATTGSALSAALAGTNKDFTMIAVFKPTAAATGFLAGWSGDSAGNQCAIVRRSGSGSSLRYGTETATNDIGIGTLADNVVHIIAWKHSAGATTAWVDSATTKIANAVAQAPAGAYTAPSFAIGDARAVVNFGTGTPYGPTAFGGDVDQVVVASGARTDAEIQQAISDLAGKWGVTLV